MEKKLFERHNRVSAYPRLLYSKNDENELWKIEGSGSGSIQRRGKSVNTLAK